MDNVTVSDVWKSVRSEELPDLLHRYLEQRYFDLNFIDLEDRYAEDVDFEVGDLIDDSDPDCLVFEGNVTFSEVMPSSCCDYSQSKGRDIQLSISVSEHSIEIEADPAGIGFWEEDTDFDYI